MTTIIWTRGETREWGVVPRDPAGASTAAAWDRAQLRIGTPPSCTVIEGDRRSLTDASGTGDGFVFPLDATSLTQVRAGVSRVALWLHGGRGWECIAADWRLMVREGCQ